MGKVLDIKTARNRMLKIIAFSGKFNSVKISGLRSICNKYSEITGVVIDKSNKKWPEKYVLSQYNSETSDIYRLKKLPVLPGKRNVKKKKEFLDRKADYNAYLLSSKWIKFRNKLREERGNKCEICGRGNVVLDGHHLTYERFKNELPEDIQIVCRPCHKKIHKKK